MLYNGLKLGSFVVRHKDKVSFIQDCYDEDFGAKMKWGFKVKFTW